MSNQLIISIAPIQPAHDHLVEHTNVDLAVGQHLFEHNRVQVALLIETLGLFQGRKHHLLEHPREYRRLLRQRAFGQTVKQVLALLSIHFASIDRVENPRPNNDELLLRQRIES